MSGDDLRLAVLADIHGNLPALEAALDDVAQQGVDRIVIMGDLADRGPFPREAVELVAATPAVVIQGDNDLDVLVIACGSPPEGWQDSLQFAPLRWTASRLGAEHLAYLAKRPAAYRLDPLDLPPMRFVHGSPRRADEPVLPDRELLAADALAMVREDVLVVAHTHEPWVVKDGERMAFNPGSVGQPYNNVPHAHYALLAGRRGRWRVEQRALPYDLERLRVAFTSSGYLAEGGALARACLQTAMTGSNHIMPFLGHAYRLAAERGYGDRPVVPDEVWLEAVAAWHWDGSRPEGDG